MSDGLKSLALTLTNEWPYTSTISSTIDEFQINLRVAELRYHIRVADNLLSTSGGFKPRHEYEVETAMDHVLTRIESASVDIRTANNTEMKELLAGSGMMLLMRYWNYLLEKIVDGGGQWWSKIRRVSSVILSLDLKKGGFGRTADVVMCFVLGFSKDWEGRDENVPAKMIGIVQGKGEEVEDVRRACYVWMSEMRRKEGDNAGAEFWKDKLETKEQRDENEEERSSDSDKPPAYGEIGIAPTPYQVVDIEAQLSPSRGIKTPSLEELVETTFKRHRQQNERGKSCCCCLVFLLLVGLFLVIALPPGYDGKQKTYDETASAKVVWDPAKERYYGANQQQ